MAWKRTTAIATIAAVALTACGGGGGSDESSAPADITEFPFDPANFDDPAGGANRWNPVTPGTQSVREGTLNVGNREVTHRIVYTVTDVTREINGVQAVVVLDQDFNGGQLAEQALDFVAEDDEGNVWSLGSYTESYEGGEFVNANDGWLAGVDGAEAGILALGDPTPGTAYVESTTPDEGAAESQVVDTGQSRCVPFQCYEDVVVIGENLDSDEPEYKYYAPGVVGNIETEPRYEGGEQETELLVNATQLSPEALAELSDEVLRLDRHAAEELPEVFGDGPPAERTL